MKQYVYKLTLQDGQQFDYKFEGGISFNHKDEDGNTTQSLITSAIFIESVDEDIVSELEDVKLVE